jgi:Rrf2 family nitric oxide-sensitive transcriptional repressor
MTLAADGYLITSRGRGGGLRLGRPASEIVIGEVVRKTESDFSMVECFQDGISRCALMPSCRLKNVLADALKAFFEKLDSVTLADLMVDAQDAPAMIRTVEFSLGKKKGATVKTE